MRIQSIATEADDIHAILSVATRARPPPPLPTPPQLELDFAAG
jgi:hypothetical protein